VSRFGKIWVRLPERIRSGDIIEVRTQVMHAMESGYRLDETGRPYPRLIVHHMRCTLDDTEVFRTTWFPAISRNPYFAFPLKVTRDGTLCLTWEDDLGETATSRVPLRVEDAPGT
jgi:sulfur-oxidizing protein SoxZ